MAGGTLHGAGGEIAGPVVPNNRHVLRCREDRRTDQRAGPELQAPGPNLELKRASPPTGSIPAGFLRSVPPVQTGEIPDCRAAGPFKGPSWFIGNAPPPVCAALPREARPTPARPSSTAWRSPPGAQPAAPAKPSTPVTDPSAAAGRRACRGVARGGRPSGPPRWCPGRRAGASSATSDPAG